MIYIFEKGNYVIDGNTIDNKTKANAVVVTNKPIKEEKEGKDAILKWDIETQEAWYEYEDILPTLEDVQADQINQLENALLEMSTMQAIKDIENEQAIMELTTMITMMGGI